MATDSRKKIYRWCRRWVVLIVGLVQFVAVIVGLWVVYEEFQIQRPKDRELRDLGLHATLAEFAASKVIDKGVAATAVRKILEVMYAEKADMTGIVIPGLTFQMAEELDLEGVDWSDADLSGTSFLCTDNFQAAIVAGEETGPCTNLKKAKLEDIDLTQARFEFADFSGADFSGTELEATVFQDSNFHRTDLYRAKIECHYPRGNGDILCSELTDVKFVSANMQGFSFRGAGIYHADFTGANLNKAQFECDWNKRHDSEGRECSNLAWVQFVSANMQEVSFRGARIYHADFTGADLNKAYFECVRSARDQPDVLKCSELEDVDFTDANLHGAWFVCEYEHRNCGAIDGLCLRGADLAEAKFENVSISYADFSNALNLDETEFENVTFENVVFGEAELNPSNFDDPSWHSLKAALNKEFEFAEGEQPCSGPWPRAETG